MEKSEKTVYAVIIAILSVVIIVICFVYFLNKTYDNAYNKGFKDGKEFGIEECRKIIREYEFEQNKRY